MGRLGVCADLEHKIDFIAIGGGIEAGLIIHEAGLAGDGRGFFKEEREIHFEMRRLRIEPLLHGAEDVWNIFHVDDIAMGVKHFDEAAHVGAFEMMRQIDEHSDSGDGVLMGVGFVADADGEAQAAHADLVDA